MKQKVFYPSLFLAIILMASCGTKKDREEIERLNRVADSLTEAVIERDTITFSYVRAFNKIQDNLDSIKSMEKMISESSAGSPESRLDQVDEINRDINAIYELLQENRKVVDDLRRQLNRTGSNNKELEQMIAHLSFQIESKDAEIAQLREDLARKQIAIDDLEQNLAEMQRLNQARQEEIKARTDEMNQAWYIIGNRKFLEENNIVIKTGGFIGIGATRKVSEDFDKELFTQIDMREVSEFPILARKAQLLTVHPAGSYEMIGVKSVDSLLIKHPDDFWSASKFMVVMVD